MTQVAVTGANGFVGCHVRAELAARGLHVRGLVRSVGRIDGPSPVTGLVEVDYENASSLRFALEGAAVVVHLVGHTHEQNAGYSVYERVNVGLTRCVTQAAADVGAHRLIFLSSIKALGNGSDEPYSERTLPKPEDAYGRSKLEAEIEVRALTGSLGTDHVILRPPLVYGAGVKGNLRRLIAAVEHALPIPAARSTANARSLISARNLASAIGEAVEWEGRIADTYVLADVTLSTAELVGLIANVAGSRPHLVWIPKVLFRTFAGGVHRGPLADRLFGSLQVDPSLFTTRFGWSPQQSVEEGLREAVESYRSSQEHS